MMKNLNGNRDLLSMPNVVVVLVITSWLMISNAANASLLSGHVRPPYDRLLPRNDTRHPSNYQNRLSRLNQGLLPDNKRANIQGRSNCSQVDVAPCNCYNSFNPTGLDISCTGLQPQQIQEVLLRLPNEDLAQVAVLDPVSSGGVVTIPTDFLGGKRAYRVLFQCSYPAFPMQNDPISFSSRSLRSSADYTVEFVSIRCNIGDTNFDFLTDFNELAFIWLDRSINIVGMATLPALPALKVMWIDECQGLSELGENFPDLSPATLTELDFFRNELTDASADAILAKVALSSKYSLKNLDLSANLLTTVPNSLRLLVSLVEVDMSGNEISRVPASSLAFATPPTFINLAYNLIETVEVGAFGGDFGFTYLLMSDNLMTRFEAAVFQPILQQMIEFDSGSLGIGYNPFTLDCGLAWIIRDNRQFLSVISGAEVEEGIAFDDLNPALFGSCP